MNNPLLILLMTGVGLYIAKLWRDDLRHPQAGGLPGASPAPRRALVIAISGALLILVFETAGEHLLGIADEQSKMTWLFALYSVMAAPVIEELVFRGYLVIEGRGRGPLWAGILVASLLFAILHPFLWKWDDSGFMLTLTLKGWFSAAVVFTTSLWLYAARFGSWNPSRSLLPCIAAHASKNIGVVLVKACTGYMGGLC